MPIYVYETVPEKTDQKPTQFEVVQRMTDEALTKHPDTGEPVRRIISGGISSIKFAAPGSSTKKRTSNLTYLH